MTDKLTIYNGALAKIGSRALASLAEQRESRRALDWAWAKGIPQGALQKGLWEWASRSVVIGYSDTIEPAFGLRRAFEKPDDFVRTLSLCTDEMFTAPLMQFQYDKDYWYADVDEIYVRYVSDDDELGMDLSRWPLDFATLVETMMAAEVCEQLAQVLVAIFEGQAGVAVVSPEVHERVNAPLDAFAPVGQIGAGLIGRGCWAEAGHDAQVADEVHGHA